MWRHSLELVVEVSDILVRHSLLVAVIYEDDFSRLEHVAAASDAGSVPLTVVAETGSDEHAVTWRESVS